MLKIVGFLEKYEKDTVTESGERRFGEKKDESEG